MPGPDYVFDRSDFALLLIRKFYPERTDGESSVIRAFLMQHLNDYDSIVFGKRVGQGAAVDPTTSPATQKSTRFSTMLRIDMVGLRGQNPDIIEAKQRLTPASLGQILSYRLHYLSDNPGSPPPRLIAIGREADADTLAALNAHGVTVYLYPDAPAPPPRTRTTT